MSLRGSIKKEQTTTAKKVLKNKQKRAAYPGPGFHSGHRGLLSGEPRSWRLHGRLWAAGGDLHDGGDGGSADRGYA